jgi:protein O-GlcNAc transferase
LASEFAFLTSSVSATISLAGDAGGFTTIVKPRCSYRQDDEYDASVAAGYGCRAEMTLEAQFDRARQLHQSGHLTDAETLYLQIIRDMPSHVAAQHLLGVLRGQQGRNDDAIAHLDKALAINPDHLGALWSYGQTLMSLGRFDEALQAFDRALTIKPNHPETLYNRGLSLAMLHRFEAAIGSYQKALAHRPEMVEGWTNLGIALAMLGRFGEAVASYEKALSLQPAFGVAWINRGLALAMMKNFDAALASYDRAIATNSHLVEAHYNRGITYLDMSRFDEAVKNFDTVLRMNPAHAAALEKRALAQLGLGLPEAALASCEDALRLQPDNAIILTRSAQILLELNKIDEAFSICGKVLALQSAPAEVYLIIARILRKRFQHQDALINLDKSLAFDGDNPIAWNVRGTLLADMKRPNEALSSYSRAIALKPDYAEALTNRGGLQWTEWRNYEGAVTDLERAVQLGYAYARGELLHVKMYGGDWSQFDDQKKAIDEAIRAKSLAIRPFAYQAISTSPADLLACAQLFSRLNPVQSTAVQRTRAHERIRIGYVSADFRDHATSHLTAGLYEQHDRAKFEIIAVDAGNDDGSPLRARLNSAFDKFIEIADLSDALAAGKILAEEIDILVDLNGYFGTARPGLFSLRPAPIQVNYLGFPGTLGTHRSDYIIADRIVIPESEKRYYTEHVVYLPNTYQVNDADWTIEDTLPTRRECGLPDDAFVFCNFNQSYKFTPKMFASWMRILKAIPGSVLWLLEGVPALEHNLRRYALQQDISAERLVFAPREEFHKHLSRLRLAGLFLDSLPYNAHTTASDALRAGVPIVTCKGTTFPGRVAASLLHAIQMPELIADNLEDYEGLAIGIANNVARMKALKEKLSANRHMSSLFDTERFCRHIESAYETMWRKWQQGADPEGFSVDSLGEPPQHDRGKI